jgi:hypothetical protein
MDNTEARVLDVAQQSCAEASMHIVWLSPHWFCSHWKLEELMDALTSLSMCMVSLSIVTCTVTVLSQPILSEALSNQQLTRHLPLWICSLAGLPIMQPI